MDPPEEVEHLGDGDMELVDKVVLLQGRAGREHSEVRSEVPCQDSAMLTRKTK